MTTETEITKTCPACELTAEGEPNITMFFGWRMDKGKKRPQSKCKECRAKKPEEKQAANNSYAPLVEESQKAEQASKLVQEAIMAVDTPASYPPRLEYTPIEKARIDKFVDAHIAKVNMEPDHIKLKPRQAANLFRLLTGCSRYNTGDEDDERKFALVLKAHCGLYVLPSFEETEPFEPKSYYYSSKDKHEAPVTDERVLADFLIHLGQSLHVWADEEQARRDEKVRKIKEAAQKEREKRKKAKEKQKSRNAKGKAREEEDEEELSDEELLDGAAQEDEE